MKNQISQMMELIKQKESIILQNNQRFNYDQQQTNNINNNDNNNISIKINPKSLVNYDNNGNLINFNQINTVNPYLQFKVSILFPQMISNFDTNQSFNNIKNMRNNNS